MPESATTTQEHETQQREREAVLRRCERFLHGHGPARMRAALEALAAGAGEDEEPDNYGTGDLIASFEHEIAGLLGKEAAVFMPSGTMVQQIALRIWSERTGRGTVAFHPTCHLELHEEKGYQYLHGLRARLVGAPHRLIALDDLREVAEPLAALLLELPQREIGGQLPEWDELQAQVSWARERGAAVHMDGARLWEAAPYYERPYAEIAALFDSVYVSFYKGLGGFAGAALAGPADFIGEARVWRRRHGGTLRTLFPFVLAARAGLRERLGRFPHYHERALAVARVLAGIPGIVVKPDPPQAHMMHVYLHGDLERMAAEALAIAREDRVGLFWRLQRAEVPSYGKFELAIGDAADAIGDDEIRTYFERIIAAGSHQEAPEVVAAV